MRVRAEPAVVDEGVAEAVVQVDVGGDEGDGAVVQGGVHVDVDGTGGEVVEAGGDGEAVEPPAEGANKRPRRNRMAEV